MWLFGCARSQRQRLVYFSKRGKILWLLCRLKKGGMLEQWSIAFLWPIKCFTKHLLLAGMSTAVIQVAALDYKDRCIPISMPVRLTRPPVLEKTGQYPWLILWMGFKNLVQMMSHPAASSSSAHIPLQSRTLKPKEPGSTWEQLLPWIPAVKCSGQINLFIFSLDISYPPLS